MYLYYSPEIQLASARTLQKVVISRGIISVATIDKGDKTMYYVTCRYHNIYIYILTIKTPFCP